jgi:uncharacterized FAD-dependent dehydrogenase
MAAQSSSKRLKITGLRLDVADINPLQDACSRVLNLPLDRISSVRILRRSLDARQRTLQYEYSLAVDVMLNQDELTRVLANPGVSLYRDVLLPPAGPHVCLHKRPIVIGAGPAGLFAALGLAERGCPPLVLERGGRITDRIKQVQAFWKYGELNPESNVVFGEGGAGAFSDGKLTARGTSPFKQRILEELVACGARENILYDARPHMGTDCLRRVVPVLVERLRKQGVEFLFNTRMDDMEIEQGRIRGIRTSQGQIATNLLVLALGHSARDTLRMLSGRGMRLQPKGFAVGVRIEHPQALIDRTMFRNAQSRSQAGAAEYSVRYTDIVSGRGVYSFCMCPGGLVIGCSSQPGTLCVNGMSFSNRDNARANAALVVTVGPDDYNEEEVLDGIVLQEQIESLAYAAGAAPFSAPAQRAADFIIGRVSSEQFFGDICYKPGVTPSDLGRLLPDFTVGPLRRALQEFDKKIPGFVAQGVLIGVETRTSSPVRMLRDPKTFQSDGIAGLFPAGEGAGYAGGIVSSAVDGLRAAWSLSC